METTSLTLGDLQDIGKEGDVPLASEEEQEELFGPLTERPRNLLGLTLFDLYPDLTTDAVASLENGDLRSVIDANPLDLDLLLQLSQLLIWRCEYYRREVVGMKNFLSSDLGFQLAGLDKELRSRIRAHKELLDLKDRQEGNQEVLAALKEILDRVFEVLCRHIQDGTLLQTIGKELAALVEEQQAVEG